MSQPHGDRETTPVRDVSGQQTTAATERSADDHLIRGYN